MPEAASQEVVEELRRSVEGDAVEAAPSFEQAQERISEAITRMEEAMEAYRRLREQVRGEPAPPQSASAQEQAQRILDELKNSPSA